MFVSVDIVVVVFSMKLVCEILEMWFGVIELMML